jgi:hypothetical protein
MFYFGLLGVFIVDAGELGLGHAVGRLHLVVGQSLPCDPMRRGTEEGVNVFQWDALGLGYKTDLSARPVMAISLHSQPGPDKEDRVHPRKEEKGVEPAVGEEGGEELVQDGVDHRLGLGGH